MSILCSFRNTILNIFWIRGGANWIRSWGLSACQKVNAKTVAERLWAAGTMGAFFTALARTVPVHMRQIASSRSALDWISTLDHIGRYAYFLWFLVYFIASNIYNENHRPPTLKDLAFDIIQAISGLTAAVFLGFLVSGADGAVFGPGHTYAAVIAANLAIALITISSLLIFGCDANEKTFNKIRRWGLMASISGLLFVGARLLHLIAIPIFVPLIAIQISGLWWLLYKFIRSAATE
jgi:hypothetical protein